MAAAAATAALESEQLQAVEHARRARLAAGQGARRPCEAAAAAAVAALPECGNSASQCSA